MAVIYARGPTSMGDFRANGTPGDDIILGTPGDDVMSGIGGRDLFLAGAGDDLITGGTPPFSAADIPDLTSNVVLAGPGNDRVFGSADRDWLFGGDGDDQLFGSGGDDVVFAGSGDDVLRGGPGDDFLDGGADADIFAFDNFSEISHETLGWFEQGLDKLDFRALGVTDLEGLSHILVSTTVGEEPSGAPFLELHFGGEAFLESNGYAGLIHIPGIAELTDCGFVA